MENIPVKDHEGKVYKNITALCTAYGISVNTYRYRIDHGMSQKEALLKKPKYTPHEKTETEKLMESVTEEKDYNAYKLPISRFIW